MSDSQLFAASPFSLVASSKTAECWSGRGDVLERLQRLMRSLSRRADASLDIMWANLGSGKTHALLHLKHALEVSGEGKVRCAYVEMPEQIRGFLDLYRRIMEALPHEEVAGLIITCPQGLVAESLMRASNVLVNGGPAEKSLATAWLNGQRPHLTELKKCSGITQRIETDITATDILCGVITALAHHRVRLMLMIDEFQRIGVLKPTNRENVLSCLRSVFSQSPEYFSVVLSIMSRAEQTAMDLIPAELKTLIGKRPTLSLPEMDVDDAFDFVQGRFDYFRPDGYSGCKTAPFGDETLRAVLAYLHDVAQIPLTPRETLQALAWIYDEAQIDHGTISKDEAIQLLGEAYETSQDS